MLRSLFIFLFVCVGGAAMAQAPGISGTLTDERGNPIVSGSVKVTSGGITRGGAVTDFDGNYTVKPLEPGLYDVTFSSQGSQQTISGVRVNSSGEAQLNHRLETARNVLGKGDKEIIVRATTIYKAPIINFKDPSSVGGLKTAADFEKSASINVQDMVSLTGGTYAQKNGADVSIGGGRVGTGTTYIVDGVQLASGAGQFATPPNGSVDAIQTYKSGIPARYGDASGGIVTITTKGVSPTPRVGIRLEHSIDGYNNNMGSFNVSAPILRRTDSNGKKVPVLGFALNGEGRYNEDPNPSYYRQYYTTDAVQSRLESQPLVVLPGSSGDPQNNYASETVKLSDLEQSKQRQNVSNMRGGFSGKLVYALNDLITVTGGAEYYNSKANNYSASNVVFNSNNNSQTLRQTGRGYIRFNQRFANGVADPGKSLAISNAFYTVQADYQKDYATSQDKNHQHNAFDYGYVGKFEQQFRPNFTPGRDSTTGVFGIRQTGYTATGINFTRDEVNPILANYTSQYYQITNPALRPQQVTSGDISRGYLRNGDNPTAVYGQFNAPGTANRGWSVSNNDQVAVQVDASFDLKQGRATHSIEFGLYYQQRNERFYSLNAANLWDVMRLTTARVNDGTRLDLNHPTFIVNGRPYSLEDVRNGVVSPGPNDTITYPRLGQTSNQTAFDRNLRQKLGVDSTVFLNTDAIDRSNYNLSMFAPDELAIANQPIVTYQGYDYTGKRLTGQVNFNDYFTQKNNNGDFTRPIGAYRPNYIAGYLSDYIKYKDFLISLGVRVERFDANTKVLKDPYSLVPTETVGSYLSNYTVPAGYTKPANVTNSYVPYVSENTSTSPTIIGYRNGETWYDATGTEVQDPLTITRNANVSRLQPLLQKQNGKVIDITDTAFRGENSFVDYKPVVNAMPRINFSFPLNDKSIFYAHYDVMVQRPVDGNYATAADYRYLIFQPTNIIGNPDLKPEKLVDYEVGFQQQLTSRSSITLSGFYKERRDQIQIRQYYQAYPTTYFTYGNRDFSTNKGFTLNYELRRISNLTMSVNYTLSFNEGTGSSAASANGGRTDVASGSGLLANYIGAGLPNLRNQFPLNYDSRHIINAQLDYRYLTGEGPTINGNHFLENAGANLIFRTRSGEPYTRYQQPNSQVVAGAVNASRLSWHYMFDLNVDKDFNIGIKKATDNARAKFLTLNVFMYVQNLLNTRDVLSVYGYTGSAGDNGYLTSAQGINQANQQVDVQSYKDLYGLRQQDINQLNNPRRIVLGIKMNF